jgi:hypothetical protein
LKFISKSSKEVKMKVITLLFSLLFCFSYTGAQKNQTENLKPVRFEQVINSQWTFNYFPSETADKGYESPGFNDSRWPAISLPHTWNSYETTGELHPFARSPGETGETYWWTGWGWYRKHFSIKSDLSDHEVFIEFKGVQKYCKIWINGRYVGDHKGGYGSFDFEITDFIKPGGDNLLAVAVNYLQEDEFTIHPLTEGAFNVSCGIYRDVTLVLKNKLFIPMQGSSIHEGGTYISTPKVSENEGLVNIKTWVKNDYPQSRTCILQTSIIERNNQPVQIIRTEALIDSGQLLMFDQTSKPVKNPHLWSPTDPYLYTIYSEVIDNKEVVDTLKSFFGFRWFRFDEKGYSVYLNDKKIELKGVNRHQEYPWLGDALPDWITGMDYSDISATKRINFVRTINYPGNDKSYNDADKQGIITEEDFSAVIVHNFSADEQKQQIREMIRRDRNHPAILSWSIGDEPDKSGNGIFALSEDSTGRIMSVVAGIDTASSYFVFGNKISPDSLVKTAGEPAKIIVSSSHPRILADRGSVVIIKADFVDSMGNPVPYSRNTLKWKVSGPAKLIGPAYYVSYADSNRQSEKGWYKETPATNLIRSIGQPGKIQVTVFSSGLASGSCEINAEEFKIYDKSVVTEPVLADAGRKPVISNSLLTERLEEIPQEISLTSEDINLEPLDITKYSQIMSEYINRDNPLADSSSIEFNTLVDLFANQLFNNRGHLSAADYNFNVEHYNNCRLISGFIAKTKLPPLFKESLKKYYSELIITRGSEKNAGDEMNWLNWIPSGGIVVIVPDEKTNTSQKGIVFTRQTELPEILRVVYPQFAKFSEDAKERALIFIKKMNPSVRVKFINEAGKTTDTDPVNSVIYSAEKGQPVLIPEYKFISE